MAILFLAVQASASSSRSPLGDLTNSNMQPRRLDFGCTPRRTVSEPLPPTTPARPKNAPLEIIERYAVVVLSLDGQPTDVVAAKVGCSEKAVKRWIEAFEDNGDVEDAYRCGRPPLLDEDMRDVILERAVEHPLKSTPRTVRRLLALDVSPKTIRRSLDDMGLFGRVGRKIPMLKPTTIQKRKSFVEGYSAFDWTKVLWSDEMSITLGPQGVTWVQRPIGEALNPVYCVETVKHPAKVHVWACFASGGVGGIEVFTENLDAPLMVKILRAHLVKSAHKLWPRGAWWFQQDNDPKHTSRLVKDFLFTAGVECIEWPPYSPDLNPIENLWANLKKRVEDHHPTSIEELKKAVYTEWAATDQELCQRLVASMTKRIAVVVENEYGPCGY